ncbi:MAG: hypothetical protein WBM90_08705, partial [Acidimicrobiia bacterium]
MSTFVKICGITSIDTAFRAVDAGADALGFVFADSARRLTADEAVRITAEVPVHVEKVAVFLAPSTAEIEEILSVFQADTVQADAASIADFHLTATIPVIRDAESRVPQGVERVLFEGLRSGTGELSNWDGAARLSRSHRLILAGGLNAGNVANAMKVVKPYGVD